MTVYQQKAAEWNAKIDKIKNERQEDLDSIKERMEDTKTLMRNAKQAMPQDTMTINECKVKLQELQKTYDKAVLYYNEEIDKIAKDKGQEDISKGRRDDRIEAQEKGYEYSKDVAKDVAKDTMAAAKERHTSNLSPSFYRDIAAAVTSGRPGNVFSDSAATQKEQARNQRNESANRQMEAQQSQQIANRNEYTEAGKVASMQNDAQNRQNIANREGLAGSAAALMRQTNTPDVGAERQRQDQQRNIANNRRELSDAAQQGATESQGLANEFGHKSDEYNNIYDQSQNLAAGITLGYNNNQNTQNTDTQNTQDNTQGADTEAQAPDNMSTRPEGTVQQPQNTGTQEPENTGTQESTEPQDNLPPTGVSDTIDEAYFDKLIKEANEQFPDKVGGALGGDRYTERNNYIQNALKQNHAWAALSPEEQEKWTGYFTPKITSDCGMKNIRGMLARHKKAVSDVRMKIIRHDFDTYGRTGPEDLKWLLNEIAQNNAPDPDDNTVLKGYADNIRNYVYNYKPEAQALSPDNDPSVTHIGPMAQDIERVNPACVSKDANGIESVDTGRIAMMNAGAIGDLARSLEDIKERLSRLEAQNV